MKYITAGESHGKGILCVMENVPANLKIDFDYINANLKLRGKGYGRGNRQKIESDEIEILSGVRNGLTIGSPLSFIIKNKDYENWLEIMSAEKAKSLKTVTKVRPGHADYVGCVKYCQTDARNILERASARETCSRVGAGAIAKLFLKELGVESVFRTVKILTVEDKKEYTFEEIKNKTEHNDLRIMDDNLYETATKIIDEAKSKGDTLGGIVEIRIKNLKSGFGSYNQYTNKLDAKIAFATMSVQACKGVEIGLGFESANRLGSDVHDEMCFENGKVIRQTNNAGGIEGGMTNGEEIIVRAVMKPIPTLMKGLKTFDLITKKSAVADTERSDVIAIASFALIVESAINLVLAEEIMLRLGGDNMTEIIQRWNKLP